MFRKLLILGAIAALLTIATVVPASAIAVNTGHGSETVLDPGTPAAANDAHGPSCANIPSGCVHNEGSAAAAGATSDVPGLGGPNMGAWNAVFGPGGISNENSAICGVTTTTPPTETCDD
jgi:hypothetical protein